MTVYLLHFSQPLGDPHNPRGQAQHYIGSADNVAQRVTSHQLGHGAAIMRACKERGIDFCHGAHVARRPAGRAQAQEPEEGAGAMPYLHRWEVRP